MRTLLPALLAFALVEPGCRDAAAPAPEAWQVASPSGRVVIEAARDSMAGGGLHQRLLYDGLEVLGWAPLGLRTADADLTRGLEWVDERRRRIDESYETVVGKRVRRRHRANELTVRFARAGGREMEIDFRASDDGAAFRYRLLGRGEETIVDEASGFRLPVDGEAWAQPYDHATPFGPAYEEFPKKVAPGDTNPQNGWSYGALFGMPDRSTYVLLAEAGLGEAYAGTHLDQPVGTFYRVAFPGPREGNDVGAVEPRARLPFETPWRVAIVGDLAGIVESTLVDDLSPPPGKDVSLEAAWLRPGRSAWSWWSQNTGDPELQREYVDFAAEMGWEYVLVDANWTDWPSPEADVRDLVAYAAERDVGIFLWYNSGGPHNVITERPRDRMDEPAVRRAEMARLASWGVRGIKVDFFQSDKQDRIGQYLGILADALEYRLLVNFHGSTLPRGWQRTYPNLVTMEAVHGAEFYRLAFGPSALDNVRLAFTRNVLGSMDYTPVTFAAALAEKEITHAHQLALSVVFESGVQHFADQADSDPTQGFRRVFAEAPFARDFLAAVPVVWDETRLLSGHPDTHVVLARRSGDEWYLGGINGTAETLELAFDPPPLSADAYEARIIAGADAADTLMESVCLVESGDRWRVSLQPRDGFVARLRPLAGGAALPCS